MAVATRGPGFCVDDVVKAEWEMARELGLPITVHVGMGRLAGRFGMIKMLDGMGLLGPDTKYIHCCYFSEEVWRLVADTGGTISIAPQVEVQMGHGWPPVVKAMQYGLRPSLSIDVVTTVPGDMFTQMRFLWAQARLLEHEAAFAAGNEEEPELVSTRDVLEFATIEGARVCGVEDRTGSLTPGKQADIVVVRCDYSNTYPIIDPVSTVVHQADTRNVDTVLVAGRALKRDGRLVDADLRHARDLAAASLEHLLEHTTVQPHWVQSATLAQPH
jgi:cytosine/adenosine deaminase-related metal-dependent hydrolase